MNVLLIGTDTLHRRFIINSLIDKGVKLNTCIFQTNSYKSSFKTTSPWSRLEKSKLSKKFKSISRIDLRRVKKIIKIKNLSSVNKECNKEIKKANFIIISGADLIKGNLLKIIKNKALNIHMGIAEKYRGLDSNLWAWYHHDYKNIGVTLHKLDRKLDTGKIFKSKYLRITKKTKIWSLRYLESILAVDLLNLALRDLNKKKLNLRKQKQIGRYYSFMPAVIKNKIHQNTTSVLIAYFSFFEYFLKVIL